MRSRRLILLTSVSMDGFAGHPDATIDWLTPAPADEQVIALREVVKAPPQLVFRLYTEAGVCIRWRVHATSNCDRQARSPGRQALPLRPSCGPTASSSPSAAPTSRSTARTGWSGSFVYEGKPEDEAIDTNTHRAGGRGNPGLGCARVHWSIAARDALRVRRRAGPTNVRPSSWHRYRSIPVSKQSCCGPSSRTPEHR
jgi:hypothetical protein